MTFNTGNNVPSIDPRDLYDNAENLDKLVNGANPFYADRKGKLRESWAGMENSFDTAQEGRETTFGLSQADKEDRFQAFLVSSGYIDIGPYGVGVEFTARNQYVPVDGQFYRPAASTALPYVATGDWQTESVNFVLLGDDVLRQDLASADGADMVGFSVDESVGAALLRVDSVVKGISVSIKDFGAVGDGVADDTAAIQAALNALDINQGFQTTDGAVTGGFVSNIAPLVFPRGIYKITEAIVCPSYMKVIANNAIIIQTNAALDIFSGVNEAYQWEIEGLHFSGGRSHANMQNNNIDVTRWVFRNCTFSLSSDFAIRTFPTGGATSHLSANLTIQQCAFYKPRKVLLNYCDSAILEDCWVFVSKDNFTPSTPVFENGSLTCDGYPNLYLKNMFGVPSMGDQGVDRLANVRWCDLYRGMINADKSRFGGESAGMPVVYNLSKPVTTYPYRGNAIIINGCECFAGPAAASDSGIVSLQGEIPQCISIKNNSGPVEVPYIVNAGGQIASIPAYLAAFETASSQKAYTQFQFEIAHNGSLAPNGIIYGERVPAGLRPYCNNFRHTKVRRTTTQVLSTGFVSNLVSFNTLDLDTQGGFDIASPTRIVMPAGATRLRIQAYIMLDGGWTGNTLRAAIVDSGLNVLVGQGFATNANADNTQYSFSIDVEGLPGDYWHLEIKHNASASQNLIGSRITTEALDYIN